MSFYECVYGTHPTWAPQVYPMFNLCVDIALNMVHLVIFTKRKTIICNQVLQLKNVAYNYFSITNKK